MELEDYDYNIGDIIYNIWKDRYYVVADYNYKNTSKFYTIKDLITDKITIDEWVHSKRLIWKNGNFNGYEKEYRLASKGEALSKYRKEKIKNILKSENEE